ncbi:nuclear transport factor 2 family protein [Prosthecobacter sp.]|uniref:nuclear transport factor 2 family protein n=1 Tax=Prosthecobacter sp. TaxID=1965333 RepID=UPI003783557A
MTNLEPAPLHRVITKFVVGFFLLFLPAALLVSCGTKEEAPDGKDADVREFLTRYFSTWSAKDMDGYGACFHEQARISFVHQGAPQSQGLTDFLHGQKLSHATTTVPMTEVPTDMKILRDERTAQASVRWKLTKGTDITLGTDCFTLIKTPAGWKIMSLVFYND